MDKRNEEYTLKRLSVHNFKKNRAFSLIFIQTHDVYLHLKTTAASRLCIYNCIDTHNDCRLIFYSNFIIDRNDVLLQKMLMRVRNVLGLPLPEIDLPINGVCEPIVEYDSATEVNFAPSFP